MPLSDIAIRCGYADQSHLVRDWRQFAGASPTQWLRNDALARV
jgi:AraC-like DNA-binding protein